MKSFRCFFYLPKSDRQVYLLLLSLAIISIAAIYFLGETNTVSLGPEVSGDSTSVVQQKGEKPQPGYYEVTHGEMAELFSFDPNTADSTQLLRLGLQPWQVRSIYRYRAKGGVFRTKEDFARVYGLTQKQYRAMEPYITISADYRPASELVGKRVYSQGEATDYKPYKKFDRDTIMHPYKIKEGETVNLAVLDTTMFKKVPGIGSGWARRIVSYGEQLGGYVHVGQLKEIDDFPEEALQYFSISTAPITRKLNVNKLSINQLRRHPYINFYQARAIADYRRLKGPLTSLKDLSLHKDFPPEEIERLSPYVEF